VREKFGRFGQTALTWHLAVATRSLSQKNGQAGGILQTEHDDSD